MFRKSITNLIKKKPKFPKNPKASFLKENWKLAASQNPNLNHQQVQTLLNQQWKEMDNYEKQEMQEIFNQQKIEYRKDLKAFHQYCQAESGLPLPTKPTAPKDTGFTLFSKDNHAAVKNSLPMDCKITDIYKAMGELWRNTDEPTKWWYNNQVKDHWDAYRLEKQKYDENLKIFENLGAPNKPKPAMTAFNLFCKENLENTGVNKNSEIMDLISLGKQWRSMSNYQKSHYENSIEVLDDKNRYEKEYQEYLKLKEHHDQKFSKPKKPLTNYQIFFMDKKPEITARNPLASGQEIMKIMADAWRNLSEEEKKPYDEQYLRNVEDFEARNRVYEENKLQREKQIVW